MSYEIILELQKRGREVKAHLFVLFPKEINLSMNSTEDFVLVCLVNI